MNLLLCLLSLLVFQAADPAQALLDKYSWKAEGKPDVSQEEVPKSLAGIPWLQYQNASKSIGLDLTPACGRKVTMRHYTLTKRTAHGDHLFIHVALLGEKVVGAWLATDGPVAPGIAPLSEKNPFR